MKGVGTPSLLSRTLVTVGLGLAAPLAGSAPVAQPSALEASKPAEAQIVLVAPIQGIIDLGLVPFVERALATAAQQGAAAVIFEVNTFGGRVDAAVAIRDHLIKSRVRTVVFVNERAISAGALIALAAHQVVVVGGATIGAAAPVQLGAPGQAATPVDEKTVSYVRKEFRATAEMRGRPGNVAEAMVDADVHIPGLVAKGKLLTLTGKEALEQKIADHQAEDVSAVLGKIGLSGATIRRLDVNWAERVVRFLTHPIVSSLLMTLAMLGLVVELRTPGFGVPGLVGLLCLVAFFWGHWLVRLVGWEEVLLVTVGIILVALEIFVFPGFGLAGALGILALLAGLTSSLLGTGATLRVIVYALARVTISAALALLGSLLLLRFLPLMPGGRRLVLFTALPGGGSLARPSSEPAGGAGLTGTRGTTLTPLRPAGIATLGGRRIDVVSTGEFVAAGRTVEVVEEAGSRVVVKVVDPQPEPTGAT